LTGKRAFEGETVTETIAAVLKSEPDWEALSENTPWRIQELLRRCLTKDRHDRLDGIANVRVRSNWHWKILHGYLRFWWAVGHNLYDDSGSWQ